jgi:hypothetical protein
LSRGENTYALAVVAVSLASRHVARRWGAGTAAIVRLLIASDSPLTGVAIADAIGVTQPRASQVLKQLSDRRAVRATEDGYVGDPGSLLDLYRHRSRPSLVGHESYWYSIRPLIDQAHRIVRAAQVAGVHIAFSADLAPDLLVPWRHPTVAIVYAGDGLDLAPAGLVPAEGRPDASVIVRRTDDRTLLTPQGPWPVSAEGFPLVDPTQQWWDLLDLGGEDRHEAADRLRASIVDRTIPGRR